MALALKRVSEEVGRLGCCEVCVVSTRGLRYMIDSLTSRVASDMVIVYYQLRTLCLVKLRENVAALYIPSCHPLIWDVSKRHVEIRVGEEVMPIQPDSCQRTANY